jgi:hypothetical protein
MYTENSSRDISGKLVIVVEDSGAGLSEENQKRLFKEVRSMFCTYYITCYFDIYGLLNDSSNMFLRVCFYLYMTYSFSDTEDFISA